MSMHRAQPSPATEQSSPGACGRAEELACPPETFSPISAVGCVRVPRRGRERPSAKESKQGSQGREGSLFHALLKAVRGRAQQQLTGGVQFKGQRLLTLFTELLKDRYDI